MLSWGLIGAGGIARVFANGVRFSKTGKLAAVASRTRGRGESLAKDFSIPRPYARYEDLLADREVEAVYISTLHPSHAECAINAARAGKHILVEKPIAMNSREAAAMLDAARSSGVFLMEAFMYRCHPQTLRLAELVQEGAIGELRMIRSALSFEAPYQPGSRLYDNSLGGGSILDVGCYPASLSRLLAGAAAGKPFADPLTVKACGMIGPGGVDHYAMATVEYPNGILAELACGIACQMPAEASLFGTRGWISVPNPWLPASPARTALMPLPLDTPWPIEKIIRGSYDGRPPQEISIVSDRDLYSYEADAVAEAVAGRRPPAVTWEDSRSNMAPSIDGERRSGSVTPLTGGSDRRRRGHCRYPGVRRDRPAAPLTCPGPRVKHPPDPAAQGRRLKQ